jgi:hypothetical protein
MYEYNWVDADDRRSIRRVVDLLLEVSKSDPFIGYPSEPEIEDITFLSKHLTGGLNSGTMHVLLIDHDVDGAVGSAALVQGNLVANRHTGYLGNAVVRPAHRASGLVTGSFREIIGRSAQLGIEHLRLDVYEGIPAEKLWSSYGFEEYGRLNDFGRVDGDSYPVVYMAQSVAQLNANIANRTELR